MRAAFAAGLTIGIAAVLAAARYFPWVDLPRLPSETTVVANGGRAERFLIRLPADRIAGAGSTEAGLRGAAFPDGAALPEGVPDAPLLIELFKIRDADGSVIGTAARHWTEAAGEPAVAWLITIPGRGAMMLAAPGEPERAADSVLGAGGYRPGESWGGAVELRPFSGADAGRVVAGRGEFDGLDGRFTEVWTLTGVGSGGELKGTIELRTVMFKPS
ncbi:MAG TPA: hypothetical protein VF329_08945 [Gammaproteobacteria bacterium]